MTKVEKPVVILKLRTGETLIAFYITEEVVHDRPGQPTEYGYVVAGPVVVVVEARRFVSWMPGVKEQHEYTIPKKDVLYMADESQIDNFLLKEFRASMTQ